MSKRANFAAAAAFLIVLAGLAAADIALTSEAWILPTSEEQDDAVLGDTSLPPIRKKPGPDVAAVASALQFTSTASDEGTLIERVLPEGFPVYKRVLLDRNDRAAMLAWIDSPQVRDVYANAKKELRQSFSPDLKDLIDERQAERGKPPRDVLSFLDPALHSDRILIVRVRQRLYELHVKGGKEPEIDRFIDALTE